jgi:hypothetical protein
LKRLLVLNSVHLPNSAGKMEAIILRSCWVQARARSKAVSSVLKRLICSTVCTNLIVLERWRSCY